MQSGGQQSDQTSNLFWMIILVIILGGLAWWAWHSYIVQYVFDTKLIT